MASVKGLKEVWCGTYRPGARQTGKHREGGDLGKKRN